MTATATGATVVEIELAVDPDAWRAVGFTVDDEGVLMLGGIRLRLSGPTHEGAPSARWTIAGLTDPAITDIDGLATLSGGASDVSDVRESTAILHPNGVTSFDHLVVSTSDLDRTCDAIGAATGAARRRVRDTGTLRQGFHRIGELIVEVVTFPGVTGPHATFWGIALNVVDIDALHAQYGDAVVSAPKDAVQTGRRISSFRESAGLGVPVAVMTPHQRRRDAL
ncbi:MAG: hypothetical protein JWL72_2735 [Ilumatobacteraceae bacterium]|nr:hypothetical protein [Ilumatobacteraceae bacterium]